MKQDNNVPQGYKQAELGIIPEDWNIKSIGEFLSIGNGHDYKGKSFGNIPVYGTGGIITHIDDYLYDGQTICIGRKGTIDKPIFHSGKIWTVDTLYYTYNFTDIEVKFIYYLLLTIDWMSLNEATGVPSLTSDRIKQITLALPPIAEQRAIAEALSDVDGLIAALDKKIAKKRFLKQGAMQQLLTGKKRLPGFTDEWVEKTLGEIGTLSMCKRIFQEETSDSGDVPFYKIGTFGQEADAFISKAKYESYKNMYRFPSKGDILISAAGTIGRTVVYDGKPAYFQDSNIIWLAHTQKQILNIYLSYVYQIINWNIENTTIARLYNDNFNNTVVLFPKSLVEQQAIATILSNMDKEIADLEAQRDKYRLLKSGMMQKLLTGQVRLK